ncbi:XRE family transcriptional regulator [soil metagenome]|nr:helix-turn-helix transcriptional regulator [Euzebyaceae bacterium]
MSNAEPERPALSLADGDVPADSSDLEAALGLTIARRVREYRLQLGYTVGQLAERSGLSKGMLSKIENAQASPSLATLARLAAAAGVPVTAFFRGLDEEGDALHVKAGQGLQIQHRGTQRGHRYDLLGVMRAPHDRFEPLLVTLRERTEVFPLYQHPGTELIYMLDGVMEYTYGRARYVLRPGDTLQFHGEITHGPTELAELPIRFLTIKSLSPAADAR